MKIIEVEDNGVVLAPQSIFATKRGNATFNRDAGTGKCGDVSCAFMADAACPIESFM